MQPLSAYNRKIYVPWRLYYYYPRATQAEGAHKNKNLLGFSLVSLLVGLGLSILVSLSALQWYQLIKKSTVQHSRVQQELYERRNWSYFITNDIKQSGYHGCRTLDPNYPVKNHLSPLLPSFYFKIDRALFGVHINHSNCSRYLPGTACERIKIPSFALFLYRIPKHLNLLTQDLKNLEDPIPLSINHSFTKGSVMAIADCMSADIFMGNTVDDNYLHHQRSLMTNISSNLSKTYRMGAEIFELQNVAYYLGKPKRYKKKAIYALYRDDLFHAADEIAAGMCSFEVLFWVKNARGIAYLKAADDMTDHEWQEVYTVRIKMRSHPHAEQIQDVSLRNRRSADSGSHHCLQHSYPNSSS